GTCSSQPCACRIISNGESIRYRSTSVEQAWRKRADLQVRLCVLRGDPGYPSSLRPESDSRQTDNVDRQQNQDTRGDINFRIRYAERLSAPAEAGAKNHKSWSRGLRSLSRFIRTHPGLNSVAARLVNVHTYVESLFRWHYYLVRRPTNC